MVVFLLTREIFTTVGIFSYRKAPFHHRLTIPNIKNYKMIVAPLTSLLKINAFKWNEDVENAFNELKRVVT